MDFFPVVFISFNIADRTKGLALELPKRTKKAGQEPELSKRQRERLKTPLHIFSI